jgi:LmbE family N-acetylglucosaminyl deacetylase
MSADFSRGGAENAPSLDFVTLRVRHVLAVCAHPDDESFGLGGILGFFVDAGVEVDLVCLTRGEASTLGGKDTVILNSSGDGALLRRSAMPEDPAQTSAPGLLAEVRTDELARAAAALGIRKVTVLDYPDGALSSVDIRELSRHVVNAGARNDALLVFDEGGVTGHPDHCRATEAALLAAAELDMPVLGWTLSGSVASELNQRLGTAFVGRAEAELYMSIEVDRARQLEAIACHRSQDNPVMRARLALQGKREWLRLLRGSMADCAAANVQSTDAPSKQKPCSSGGER